MAIWPLLSGLFFLPRKKERNIPNREKKRSIDDEHLVEFAVRQHNKPPATIFPKNTNQKKKKRRRKRLSSTTRKYSDSVVVKSWGREKHSSKVFFHRRSAEEMFEKPGIKGFLREIRYTTDRERTSPWYSLIRPKWNAKVVSSGLASGEKDFCSFSVRLIRWSGGNIDSAR